MPNETYAFLTVWSEAYLHKTYLKLYTLHRPNLKELYNQFLTVGVIGPRYLENKRL